MKRIIGIFTAFLLPALPAFGAFDDFAQSYDSCQLDVNFDTVNMELSDLPEKYQKMVETHAKEKVTKAFKGHCNNVAYSCEPGDYVTCNPCELLFYIEDLKDQYTDELIEEKCGHLKKTTNKTNSTATSTKQNTKTEPENNFDFAAASANDMNTTVARSGLGNTPAPEPTTPEKSERQKQIEANTKKALTVPTKKKLAQTKAERERLERTALTKFCKDDGYVYKKNAIETPSIGYVQDLCNSESKVKFVCYNFKGASIPTQEIIKHFANYCYTNTTNSCESIKESRPSDHYNKKDAQRAEKQEQNKIGKRCEIANAKSAKYTEKPSGAIVCEPDECVCGYDIVVKESNKYTCQKWTKAPSCLSQDLDTNATKGHYECKNNKKVCVIDECDYKAHYLNSAKNKCIAKSTVKCGNDEIVNNAGKCQKNIKVGPMNNSDLEMTQDDINRDNCIRGQDKKHTKWENNKCVCENADYEMQSDGYCTLKRAKCLKQRNTKYENGRCVCTSADFEMGADNNCTMTDAASVTADREAAEIAFACSESGGTMNDQGKCECGKGYKPDGQGACEPNKRTLSNEEKKILCEKEGAGTWTSKNKCECTNKTHSFDDEVGCTENKNKVKRAEKETANNHKKELCTEPNKWNDTLKKCTCKDKKQFFDEETGCVSATADFLAAETELNTLKQQFETKKAELASAN